ncbi:MAG: phytanoyl-CoA dioxygenase family protein [Betaproteobacteria bacterium]
MPTSSPIAFVRRYGLSKSVRLALLKATHPIVSILRSNRLPGMRTSLVEEAISDLRTQGVHVTSVERLLGPAAPAYREAIARATAFVAECAGREHPAWTPRGASTDLGADELLKRFPEFYLLGLNQQVLSLAEQYLQVPVAYHGAVLRHSLVDGQQVGPRLWHRDSEDFHVLRTVVYLSDVTEESGPFEYIPRHVEIDARRDPQMCTSETMQQIVPKSEWRRCCGPAGTVVIADSAQIFHHESLQRRRDRMVIMMGHSSRRPTDRELALVHFQVEANAELLASVVPADAHPHVFGWRQRGH